MPADGSDYTLRDWGAYQDLNELKNGFAGAVAPSKPAAGVRFFKTSDKTSQVFDGSIWRTLVSTTNKGIFPVGTIIAWIGGYFTNGSNGGYTRVLGSANTIAAVNALYNSSGWYVCNGAALNLSASPIFNGPGRYLPNLTDDRFIQGDNAAGGSGGTTTKAHTHDWDIALFATGLNSSIITVDDGVDACVPASPHSHNANPPVTTSGQPSMLENRPSFLTCFYLMRVR